MILFPQEENLYVPWVLLAQRKWKCTVGISNWSQLPNKIVIPIPLADICFLWKMLEDAPVRKVSLVISHLWIFSSSQISSADWSRAAFHVSDLFLFLGISGKRWGKYSVICCVRGRKIFLKKDLFPSHIRVREENLSWDLHGAFLPLGLLRGSCFSHLGKEFLSSSPPQIHLQIFPSFPTELKSATELQNTASLLNFRCF